MSKRLTEAGIPAEKLAEWSAKEFRHLAKAAPQLFCGECDPLRILYIGGSPDHMRNARELKELGHRLALLEIVPKWASALKKTGIFDIVKTGDVRNVQRLRFAESIDVVYWRHGPEHLPIEDVVPTIKKLERIARHLVLIQVPSGPTPWVKPDPIHPSQTHRCVPEEPLFWKLGYRVHFIPSGTGRQRGDGAQMVAWKWISPL